MSTRSIGFQSFIILSITLSLSACAADGRKMHEEAPQSSPAMDAPVAALVDVASPEEAPIEAPTQQPSAVPLFHQYTVAIDPQLDEKRVQAVKEGIAMLNARIGVEGFVAVMAAEHIEYDIDVDWPNPVDWQIQMLDGEELFQQKRLLGLSYTIGKFCQVGLKPKMYNARVVEHELLHCMDIGHEENDENNLMFANMTPKSLEFTDAQATLVLDRLYGLR